MTLMLSTANLNTHYGKAHILRDVNLRVEKGECVALLGRNGAGKSTTMKAIIGMIGATSGEIRYRDKDLSKIKNYHRARLGIGYVPEERRIFRSLTVREHLITGIQPPHGKRKPWTVDRIFKLFPKLGELQDRLGGQLSGGEQQMLTVARSRIGSAMMELIAEEIKNKTPQQPNLRGILMSDAAELGLLPTTRQGQGNVKTLAQLLNISLTPATPPNHDLMRDMIKDWGAVFGANAVAKDGNQLEPFLPVLERSFAVMKADRDHFISFISDPSDVDLTQAQGPFELSNIRKIEFERRGNDTYLLGDEENKPFEHNRLLKASQVIGSLTIPNNKDALWARYLAASREQKKTLQAFSLLVSDDNTPDSERVLIALRSEPAPVTPKTQVAWKNDIRPSTVIIGNGPIAPEMENKLQEISGKPNRGLITYFDASQGVDVNSILDALRRDGNHKADLGNQLGSILEPPAMQRVAADQRSMLQRAASGITGRDSEAEKIARIIKEILRGEEVKGYVAVTTPTRTADLMKGLKNIQSARPNGVPGARAAQNGGPGGVQ